MFWISIILGILEQLPHLITLFKEIWAKIHHSPEQHAAFRTLLLAHKAMKDHAAAEAAFRAFHAQVTAS